MGMIFHVFRWFKRSFSELSSEQSFDLRGPWGGDIGPEWEWAWGPRSVHGTRMLWLNHECSHVSGFVQLWNSWICCEVVTDARCGIGCWTHSVGTRDWRLTWCFVGWCENQGPDILSAALFRTEIVTDSRLVGPPHWKLNKDVFFSKFPLDTDTGTWGIFVCPFEVYLQTEPGSKDRECCRGSNVFQPCVHV